MTLDDHDTAFKRQKMIDEQLVVRGITNSLVLESFKTVPRHFFVPDRLKSYAYADTPLAIGEGQTISQPYIVALMTQTAQLNATSKVLEIGTGSGYAAAILSRIAAEVYTIERLPSLAYMAQERFQKLGYMNIVTRIGDGTMGWEECKPFDAILVTAGAPVATESLLSQLNVHGRLVIPVGDLVMQELRCYQKVDDRSFKLEVIERVRFVPLIGSEGWDERLGTRG
ncbi:protein-L-isoaspartate O-methyltransferase [Candidatus Protochlamydia naegleriophila]|uniref:Protein-L-isoaspartate O-methyltransferase n=1 Tax=Candidatus Protochlamydia naegleriophila TaxID=389348 RepID=A0A0U5ETV7_9BACT|nr:protein-L-isoaspartate(D-aspartate) O-methyltransferase [Candidatus Protochlamydia naegleriophila]CUI17699.1 protein-L-isoaspartate O-methyltransferase [Candidatus Protochlamydia naegleriophila]